MAGETEIIDPAASPGASPAPAPAPEASPQVSAPGPSASTAAAAAAAPAADPAVTDVAPAATEARELSPLEKLDADKAEKAAKEATDKAAKDAAKPEAKADAKPAEQGAADAAKAADPAKPAEAADADPAAPFEYKYTLPETLKVNDTQRTELHTALDTFRTNPAEGAQALVDLHNKLMSDYATQTLTNQISAFNKMRREWRTQLMADPEVGGAGHETALQAVARMRDRFVSSAKTDTPKYKRDMQEFSDMLAATGVGDHPAFSRYLHNVAAAHDEPRLPAPNPRPPAGNGKAPGGFKEVMYDHPRSTNGRA